MPEFKPRSPEQYTSDDYLHHLTRWKYRKQNKQDKRRIAIIGAGMSGLTCGWLLQQAGHTVRIFEAGNVVGGRVKTLRHGFSSDLYAEAGAMRVPKSHKLTGHLVEKFALPTWDFKNSCETTRIFVNDRRSTRQSYDDADSREQFGFLLTDCEKRKTAEGMLEEAIEKLLIRRCPDVVGKSFKLATLADSFSSLEGLNRLSAVRSTLDQFSLRSFFAEEVSAERMSKGAVDLITLLEGLETHLSASLTAVLDDHLILTGAGGFYQIQKGMDYLPKAFLKLPGLADSIRYNSRVIEIEQQQRGDGETKTDRVFVTVENTITGHINEADKKKRKKWFDLVVIAIPFSALRRMRMKGLRSSPEKRKAIRQLHYDNACKILLEFTEPFWAAENITGGSSITDLPIRRVCYPIKEQYQGKRRVLLASYTWGDDSLRWTSLKHRDRIRFALRDIIRVHNIKAPKQDAFRKACIGGMSHSWAEDEFTSGAFALFEPFQLSTLFNDVWCPEGLVHYCGEHTSLKHGWIEGAVESGIRAADEICSRINHDPSLTAPIGRPQNQ
jgi:monoamine oxidase